MGQRKHCDRLPLSIGVNRLRANGGCISEQAIDQKVPFPGTAAQKMRVQGHIEIRNQMIGNASIRSIANMIGGEQVVFVEVQFCSICSCDLLVSPSLWQIILVVAIDQVRQSRLHFLDGDMATVGKRQLMLTHSPACAYVWRAEKLPYYFHTQRPWLHSVRQDRAIWDRNRKWAQNAWSSERPHSYPKEYPGWIDLAGADGEPPEGQCGLRELLLP